MHIGLIGTGRIGTFHAQGLARMEGVDRLTIVDVDQRRSGEVAAQLGAETMETAEELVRSGVDAVVIAAATPAHGPLLHLAAEAGVPAFCEKPIALDLASTDAVIEHVDRAGILVQIGFQRRFDTGYQAAREAVADGVLGSVQVVRLGTHDPKPPPLEYVAASGGIWRDLAIHDFDIVQWVLQSRVAEVYADGQATQAGFAESDDIDTACAILRFESGALGIFSGARVDPRGYDVRMEIFGTRDSVAVGVDARTPLRSLEESAARPAVPTYQNFIERFTDAYRAEIREFVSAVRDGTPSKSTVREARLALVAALAADRSRREHRPVRLREVGG